YCESATGSRTDGSGGLSQEVLAKTILARSSCVTRMLPGFRWHDAMGNLGTAGILCQFEVVVGLKVGPKLRRRSKVARQAERGARRNRPFAPNNVIHPCRWHD